MRLSQRLKKIEDRVYSGGGFAVFVAGGTEEERAARFATQEVVYLKAGGDPGAMRIRVIDRLGA